MATDSLFSYGILENVMLTAKQYEALLTKLGRKRAEKYINQLSTYIPNRTKKAYKNHYAVILTWALRDEKDDDDIEARHDDKEPAPRRPTPTVISYADEKIRRQQDAGRRVRELLRGAAGDRDGAGDPGGETADVQQVTLRFD